jgi:aspartyl-tRNA(Asn)/glutamyl-tRNA(Gln) amidotransferase subunit B
MRSKEDAADYRYFPEPDLPPVYISPERVKQIAGELPTLPDARIKLYEERFGIAKKDAQNLTTLRENADLFEAAAEKCEYVSVLAKQMLTFVVDAPIPLSPCQLAEIADMTGGEEINSKTAKSLLSLCQNSDLSPKEYAASNDLFQISDRELLWQMLCSAAENDPKSAQDYKNGKAAAGKALLGAVVARSGGRADARLLGELLPSLKS